MYTAAELNARRQPNNWRIVNNSGAVLSAINSLTNETFTGTLKCPTMDAFVPL